MRVFDAADERIAAFGLGVLDVSRTARDEISVVVTGATSAPVVRDEDTGADATLRPAQIPGPDYTGLGLGDCVIYVDDADATPRVFWWGELPIDPAADTVRLAVSADGECRRFTASWPEAAPPPAPPALPKRRGGRPNAR